MNILDIKADQFPLFLIESLSENNGWRTFTVEPFFTKEEAESHLQLIANEYGKGDTTRLRVSEYTQEHWKEQLMRVAMSSDIVLEACVDAFIDSKFGERSEA